MCIPLRCLRKLWFSHLWKEELVNCSISLVLNLLNHHDCLFLQLNAPPEKILENIPYDFADIDRPDRISMAAHTNNSRTKLACQAGYKNAFKGSEDHGPDQARGFCPV